MFAIQVKHEATFFLVINNCRFVHLKYLFSYFFSIIYYFCKLLSKDIKDKTYFTLTLKSCKYFPLDSSGICSSSLSSPMSMSKSNSKFLSASFSTFLTSFYRNNGMENSISIWRYFSFILIYIHQYIKNVFYLGMALGG